MAARAVHSTAVGTIPIRRMRAAAPLAIAREIERNEFVWQVKQAMRLLSDQLGGSRHMHLRRGFAQRRRAAERTEMNILRLRVSARESPNELPTR